MQESATLAGRRGQTAHLRAHTLRSKDGEEANICASVQHNVARGQPHPMPQVHLLLHASILLKNVSAGCSAPARRAY